MSISTLPRHVTPPEQAQPTRPSLWARSAKALGAALIGFALAGCASFGVKPEDQVKALAQQRWQHLVAGDFDKAYEMATPGYRKLHDVRYYRNKRSATPVKWIAAEVLRVNCEPANQPTKCTARIKLESKPMVAMRFPGNLVSGLDEVWLFEDGRWWMFETL